MSTISNTPVVGGLHLFRDFIDPDEIYEYRMRHGLTQREMARLVGCTKNTICHWEHGWNVPIDRYQRALKRVLGR